ncbi:Cytochrome b561 domain-containing protein [Mycena indigotica]|uniref:Cytochrome b561 domain-containing protein n=1 Tax=Mycena indigotica TaxID=2126181 RepID=A0A8H6S4Z2_9AGAR|nr:Cytochrome b561 domain-containing protein [Mycena indigotica]KAF7292151.1 Cytochrome b561 domain-containing protein [Mycena indigotica]
MSYQFPPSSGGSGSGSSSSSGPGSGSSGPGPSSGSSPISPNTVLSSPPLNFVEIKARNHGLVMTIGFLIMLPIGVLVARYTRTYTRHWFWSHAAIQLVLSGPLIFYGWAAGNSLARELEALSLHDTHQNIGVALLAMYVTQLLIGVVVHFFKVPRLFLGRPHPPCSLELPPCHSRPKHPRAGRLPGTPSMPSFNATLLTPGPSQVHYGLQTEWPLFTGGIHKIPDSAFNAWMALIIVFWVLYAAGLLLLPRQFKQESTARAAMTGTAAAKYENDLGAEEDGRKDARMG